MLRRPAPQPRSMTDSPAYQDEPALADWEGRGSASCPVSRLPRARFPRVLAKVAKRVAGASRGLSCCLARKRKVPQLARRERHRAGPHMGERDEAPARASSDLQRRPASWRRQPLKGLPTVWVLPGTLGVDRCTAWPRTAGRDPFLQDAAPSAASARAGFRCRHETADAARSSPGRLLLEATSNEWRYLSQCLS